MPKWYPEIEVLTIGKKTYKAMDILELVYRVRDKFRRQNLEILNNPYAPRFLGADLNTPKPIEKNEADIILMSQGIITPTLRRSIERLERLDTNEASFLRVFYSAVGKYYGVTRGQAYRLSRKGKLRAPVNFRPPQRNDFSYERYKRFVKQNIRFISADKVDKITDVGELNKITQHWELTGRTRAIREYASTKQNKFYKGTQK